MRGGRSPSQMNASSIDDRLRAWRPRRPRRRARGRRPPRRSARTGSTFASWAQSTTPSIDLAYGSSSSLAGLKRWPSAARTGRPRGSRSAARARLGQVAVPVERGALGHRDRGSRCPRRRTGTARRRVACSEKSEKFVPPPSQVAPSGNGRPGQHRLLKRPALRTSARARRRSVGDHRFAVRGEFHARSPRQAIRRALAAKLPSTSNVPRRTRSQRSSSSNSIASASPGGRRAAERRAARAYSAGELAGRRRA